MYQANNHSFLSYTSRIAKISEEEDNRIKKRIPNNVAVFRYRSSIGYSMDGMKNYIMDTIAGLVQNRRDEYESALMVDTIIVCLPSFVFGTEGIREKNCTHLRNYRDCEQDRIHTSRFNTESRLFEVVQEVKSGKNPESNGRQLTLSRIIKANDEFKQEFGNRYGQNYIEHIPSNIYIITSAYIEPREDSTVSSLKALHLFIKGIGFIINRDITFSLRKWIEIERRKDVASYISNLVEETRNKRDNLVSQVDDLKSSMNSLMRQLNPIEYFLADQDGVLEKIHQELESCEKIRHVEKAYLDRNGTFHIYTDHIYIKQPTTQTSMSREDRRGAIRQYSLGGDDLYWDIGRLHIKVERSGRVYILSNTRQVRGIGGNLIGHPHVVNPNGKVCLGEIESIVYELLHTHEYSSLSGILVNFAKSVNLSDSAGKFIVKWPVVKLNPS